MSQPDDGINDYSSNDGEACSKCLTWFFFTTWYPCQNMKRLTIYCILAGLFFLILAIIQFSVYLSAQQFRQIYVKDGSCISNSVGLQCQQKFTLSEDLNPPILLLYVIQNTYINHRKYLDSHSNNQLSGKTIDMAQAKKDCAPFVTNSDFNISKGVAGSPLDPSFIASPCGFMAKLTFNDTFSLYSSDGSKINIDQTGISNNINSKHDFKNGDTKTEWIQPQNEHFMNWMQNQALLTKYKLWGRISEPLKAGDYLLRANNNFNLGSMAIRKGIELVSPSLFGGRILFFPLMFSAISISIFIYLIAMNRRLKNYDDLMIAFNMNER